MEIYDKIQLIYQNHIQKIQIAILLHCIAVNWIQNTLQLTIVLISYISKIIFLFYSNRFIITPIILIFYFVNRKNYFRYICTLTKHLFVNIDMMCFDRIEQIAECLSLRKFFALTIKTYFIHL